MHADGSSDYAEMADCILEKFVLIPRSELPNVSKVEHGSFVYVETSNPGSWSYGLHPDEAPSASDPAHLIAIIEWFREQGLPLQGEES
jgi:hypothetical protein